MMSFIRKIAKPLAIGVFFIALFFNVKLSLTNPTIRLENAALAQASLPGSGTKPTVQSECKSDPSTMCTFNTTDDNGTPIIATAPGWTKN